MKTLLQWLLSFLIPVQFFAQTAPFDLYLEEWPVTNLGGTQAYAFAQHNGKWLIIGGRLDGLHKRQPFASFDVAGNNNQLIVVDPVAQQVWTSAITSLSVSLQEQLSSTNMEFHQEGDYLYIVGGYGYNAASASRMTFDYLTAINVPMLITAITTSNNIAPAFRQLQDAQFAVTGGHLKKIGSTYYLLGGNRFDGNYNPMGNPTYTQVYTNAIRKFQLTDNGTAITITQLPAFIDATNLHRRDYNAAPQILPNGAEGISMFSGVFQPTVDLPFLNSVRVDSLSYSVESGFQQYYNHYHCAVLPVYSANNNQMHTVFFGGISQYYDLNGVLTQDNNVPFVNTIARVTRDASGNLSEYKLPTNMPGLLGASAEFIPNLNLPHYRNEVLKLDSLPADTNLAGYIYGGISSTAANVFFSNASNASTASASVYKVYLIKQSVTGLHQLNPQSTGNLQMQVFPNPGSGKILLQFRLNHYSDFSIRLTDSSGRLLLEENFPEQAPGEQQLFLKNHQFSSAGIYFLRLQVGEEMALQRIVITN